MSGPAPGQTCGACNHPDAKRLNDALNKGVLSRTKVAAAFGLHKDTVNRHVNRQHQGIVLKGAQAPGASIPVDPNATPRERTEAQIAKLEALRDSMSGMTRISLERELRLAYLDLEKMGATAAQITKISDLPGWAAFKNAIVNALEPYPDAMEDVLLALDELDLGDPEPPAPEEDPDGDDSAAA